MLLAVLAGCGATEPQIFHFDVQGTVTAAADGSPIVNAMVSAGEVGWSSDEYLTKSLTDRQGRYSLTFFTTGYACHDGRFVINASKTGFQAVRITQRAVEGGWVPSWATYIRCTEETQTIHFRLEREP
jgi:hypothetical protein